MSDCETHSSRKQIEGGWGRERGGREGEGGRE